MYSSSGGSGGGSNDRSGIGGKMVLAAMMVRTHRDGG
jgi:hypothetical protein